MHTYRSAVATMLLAGSAMWVGAAYAAPRSQDPAAEFPRDPASILHATQLYQLPARGTVQHEQFNGLIRRVDATGKEVARARVPASQPIEKSTTLVFSFDFSRILMVHTISDFEFGAKHRVAILETERLRTVAEFSLGKCDTPGPFPIAAEHLTMVCYHSRPPGDRTQKPTLAVVTVNIARAEVVRWFPLGGKRKGNWFGPMFFGWEYDVRTVDVREGTDQSCPSLEGAPPVVPGKRAGSDLILVLNRDAGPPQTEVWSVSAQHTEKPRRVAVLPGKAAHSVLCDAAISEADAVRPARLVFIAGSDNGTRAGENGGAFLTVAGQPLHIVDIATGRLLGR